MRKKDLYTLYFATILTTCLMYATQPIQPLFAELFELSKFKASLFTTAILAPLAVASIFYGYLLEKFPIKNLLVWAFFIFGILEIVFALSNGYKTLLSIRIIQGLIAPLALTGIMSYLSLNSTPSEVGLVIARYIGITIVGGFVGRFLSGFFTDLFNWRVFFILLGISLLFASHLCNKLSASKTPNYLKPTLKELKETVSKKNNLFICLAAFCIFFTFQAVLNFLPFYLMSFSEQYSGFKTGIVYFGYTLGVVAAFNARLIVSKFNFPSFAIIAGIALFAISLQFLHLKSFVIIFIAMLFICLGNFIAHSISTGTINKMAQNYKAITNGLYVSFYYAGGTFGTILPPFIYKFGGWHILLIFLTLVLFLAGVLIKGLHSYESRV